MGEDVSDRLLQGALSPARRAISERRAKTTWPHLPTSGTLTNDIVYSRLAPGVLEEIKRKNPAVKTMTAKKGYRRNKNFQWLTEDIGSPKLNQHLGNSITLMKACPDGGWEMFKTLIDRALPPYSDLPMLRAIEEAENAVRHG
jgi:hypothetical protein